MIRKFKKQLALLFTGSFTMVLAACYGAPVDVESDIMIQTVNEQNVAIKGLKVNLTNNGERVYEDYTDNNGNVYYPYLEDSEENDYALKIEDVDGEENNGHYYSKVVNIHNKRSEYIINMAKL